VGKVAKPLTLVVFPPLGEWPEILKLEKQGHKIIRITEDEAQADIILGPRCWMMTPLHRKHLTTAIKQSRLRKYGSISKRKKAGDDNEKPSSDDSPESAGC